MRISDVLRSKGSTVATVGPATTVSDLLDVLAEHNCGAIVVVERTGVAGIVSERDVVRCLTDRGADLLAAPVSDIMTTVVATCVPEDTVDDVARTMTERRVRHVPVVVDEELCGIVSIGDLVKVRISELESEREQLHSYISSAG